MADEREAREREEREGGRETLGILATLRDALEEVMAEARDKGGLSAERAREALRGAMGRARTAAEGARERLDLVTHQELQEVRDAVNELKVRLENLERRVSQEPSVGPSRPAGGPAPGSQGPAAGMQGGEGP